MRFGENPQRSTATMKVKIRDGILTVRLPVNCPARKSKSGKTLVVASSGGPRRTAQRSGGKSLVVSIAAWIRPDKSQKTRNCSTKRLPQKV